MRFATAFACLVVGLLYLGQVVSVLRFPLAQRLGLQEKPGDVDPLYGRLELWTARWDLLWLWTAPVAGVLALLNHPWWPYAALIGGSALVDTGGREAAKILALRRQGVRTGTPSERRLAMDVHAYFLLAGLLAIVAGLREVL